MTNQPDRDSLRIDNDAMPSFVAMVRPLIVADLDRLIPGRYTILDNLDIVVPDRTDRVIATADLERYGPLLRDRA